MVSKGVIIHICKEEAFNWDQFLWDDRRSKRVEILWMTLSETNYDVSTSIFISAYDVKSKWKSCLQQGTIFSTFRVNENENILNFFKNK